MEVSGSMLTDARQAERRAHLAVLALLFGTVFWGMGFTWAKSAGEALNHHAGLPHGSMLGPVLLLMWRFIFAAVILLLAFPAARRGWSRGSVGHASIIGIFLAGGLILQHIGLDRTTEAVSAFLTSLTILFVPLLMTFALRRPPRPVMWAGVVLATIGVWMMTGAAPAGFGVGEALGLACAVVFAFHIIAVNLVVPRDEPWRMTAGQFLIVGILSAVMLMFVEAGPRALLPREQLRLLIQPDVWPQLLLLTLFPTVAAFSLLIHYQPRVTPTRAALVYMFEPVFATIFAWIMVARVHDPIVLLGAGLILLANVLAELLGMRQARSEG